MHNNNNNVVFVVGLCGRANDPARGPWARSGLGLKYDNCVAGRAWASYFNLCPGRVCTTAAGPGLDLKSYFRAGPGPKFQARAGP